MKFKVIYDKRFPTWHKKSCPRIVDNEGKDVGIYLKQNVNHPGSYDVVKDTMSHLIVKGLNSLMEKQT